MASKTVRAAERATRGKGISREATANLRQWPAIPQDAKDVLLTMTPGNYIGIAAQLAKAI